MSKDALATTAQAGQAVQAIPFRPEGEGIASSSASALGVIVVLLACAWGVALYARRRGWLARWVAPVAQPPANGGLRLASRLRLSPRTVLYAVVDDAQRQLLVAETPTGVQVVQLQAGGDAP